jgi:hypothetical protein
MKSRQPPPTRADSRKRARKLRVAILGTSNSIMRDGYIAGLGKKRGIEIVANASLGSSHAPMLAYRLPDLERVAFDIVILDLCINEQHAAYRNLENLPLTTDVFGYFLDWCGRKRVMPAILILPDQSCFGYPTSHPRANEVHNHYVNLCKKHRIPYFDGRRFVMSLAKSRGGAPAGLFKDANHLAPVAAQLLGKRLGKRLRLLETKPPARRTLVRSHAYVYVPVPAANTLERKTSIATVRFARMDVNSRLPIPCPPRCHVVAVALNMSQTNAALKISGNGQLFKRLDNAYFDPSRSMWFVIWSLLNPVAAGTGGIHLSVVPSSLTTDQEDNDHSRPGLLPPPDREPVAEVSGIVVRTPKRWRLRYGMKYKTIDLLDPQL